MVSVESRHEVIAISLQNNLSIECQWQVGKKNDNSTYFTLLYQKVKHSYLTWAEPNENEHSLFWIYSSLAHGSGGPGPLGHVWYAWVTQAS